MNIDNNKNLKICLVGTSNSIFKNGYAKGISTHPNVKSLTKLSIGASPSIIIPYFLIDEDMEQFDLVIFETAINDRNYYKNKSIYSKQIYNFINWGIKKSTEAKCKTALLVMPTKTAFKWETISEKIYQRISKDSQCFLFNGFNYIRLLTNNESGKIFKCFKDEFHLSEDVAFQLGRSFVEEFISSTTELSKIGQSPDFRKINYSNNYAFIKRKTSLMEKYFNIIDENNSIDIKIDSNEYICGISLNATKSYGIIKIEGKDTIYKNINTNFIKIKKNMQTMVVPITTKIEPKEDGTITISTSTNYNNINEHGRFDNAKNLQSETSYIEIGDIIVAK